MQRVLQKCDRLTKSWLFDPSAPANLLVRISSHYRSRYGVHFEQGLAYVYVLVNSLTVSASP